MKTPTLFTIATKSDGSRIYYLREDRNNNRYLIFKSVEKGILKAKLKESDFSVEQEFDTREQAMNYWDTIEHIQTTPCPI